MARHTFTREQMDMYFDRICMPQSKRVYDVINVRPSYLFKKIVHHEGVGGYCIEVNYLFHLILYNLGFSVYMAGSRIFHPDTKTYGGWTHVVNIVTIGTSKCLLDGGMGPNGPHCAMPLQDGEVIAQISPAQMRLDYESIGQHLDKSQKMWVFRHRYDQDLEMVPVYCFTDQEFTPEDVESMNFEPMLNPQTIFAHKILCVRFTTDRETNEGNGPGSASEESLEGEIHGSLSLNHDILKWRRHGKKETEITLKSEESRLEILKKYFGITFLADDTEPIHGTAAHIELGPAQGAPAFQAPALCAAIKPTRCDG
ncbi:cysteine proteinase [Mollisia scopiformis]|uniref:Cysteine proteinase n=1 Tax=Mollisia scopiformis TaxID=149040 RepID=A0A194WV02_MOLSC|nr:cysteine proteinase [Mollisia scopiformis]KUJ11790.1 cysteine proteinase [Mollisia scopiformis]